MKKEEPKSSCCNEKIDIEERVISQMSFDPHFFCSKCRKELKDVEAIQFNW